MRQAGICVWQAHQLVRQMVAPGRHHGRDRRGGRPSTFASCGAQPLFKNYPHQNSGRPPFPAATCTSVNEEVVHGIPNDRPLRRRRHRQRRHRLPAQRLVRRRGRDLSGRPHRARVQRLLDVTDGDARSGVRADAHQEPLEPGRPRDGQVRPRPRLLDGRVLRRPRHRPARCTKSRRCRISSAARCAAAATSASSRAW